MKIFVTLCLLVMVSAALVSAGTHGVEQKIHSLTQLVDKVLGSKTVEDKLAELTQSTAHLEREEIIILSKADVADDIPEGDLHNTTTITRKIGDVTVVVEIIISKLDGDGIMVEFRSHVKPPSDKKICTTDSNCTEHQFCHHDVILGFGINYCQACSSDGGKCQIDKHCCGQTLCRWGRCRQADTRGQFGTICSKASDCGDGGCCALVEGFKRPVCRPLANEGQRCSSATKAADKKTVSSSLSVLEKLLRHRLDSDHVEFHHDCPCTAGLKCAYYMQGFDDMFDLGETAHSFGGVCVPGWAWEDEVVSTKTSSKPKAKK